MGTNILEYIELNRSQIGKKVFFRKTLKKEIILHSFKCEDQISNIYLVTSGIALVQVQNKLSEKNFYSLISKNQLFGIDYLLDESQRPKEISYTVIAQTDVEYLEIERNFFLDYLYIEPINAQFFLKNMISQYMILAQSYQLMNESVMVRIADTLINLISILNLTPNHKGTITFPKIINQKLIANYTNASIGRTSTVFKYLEKNKIIKRAPIRIIDLEKLIHVRALC